MCFWKGPGNAEHWARVVFLPFCFTGNVSSVRSGLLLFWFFGPVEFSHGSPALTCLRQPLTPPPSCLLGRFALGKCADENQVTESV